MKSTFKRILPLTLAAVMVLSLAAGCKRNPKPSEDDVSSSSSVSSSSKADSSSSKAEKSDYQVVIPKENREQYDSLKAEVEEKQLDDNGGVVAYIEIPNTDIKNAVVQYDSELDLQYYMQNGEMYYERKDIFGNYLFEGCFWMDYEDKLGTGSPEDMPKNTIIYGHHMGNPRGTTNDPDGVMFGQLLRFRDKDFAEKNPYIYLTTEKGDLIYQVFAASDTPTVPSPIEYNLADYSDEDFLKLVEDMRKRSYFSYPDVDVNADDKILTLSTCVYDYGTYAENNKQRFVVFAKLVTDENFAETANVVENTNRKLPPYDPNAK